MKLLTALRLACLVEAISALVLFCVAMPLKHYGGMPKATLVPGIVHGGLVIVVLGLLVVAFSLETIRPKLAAWVFLGAIVPGVAFFVDGKLKRAAAAEAQ